MILHSVSQPVSTEEFFSCFIQWLMIRCQGIILCATVSRNILCATVSVQINQCCIQWRGKVSAKYTPKSFNNLTRSTNTSFKPDQISVGGLGQFPSQKDRSDRSDMGCTKFSAGKIRCLSGCMLQYAFNSAKKRERICKFIFPRRKIDSSNLRCKLLRLKPEKKVGVRRQV